MTNVSTLNTAIADAASATLASGSVIILEDGTYNDSNLTNTSNASLGLNINGTATDKYTFAARNQGGAHITRSNTSYIPIRLGTSDQYVDIIGLRVTSGTSPVAFFGSNGCDAKWLEVYATGNQPGLRHRGCDDGGLYYSKITGNTQSQNEGHYVGWGSDPTLYSQDNIKSIGNWFIDCAGGSLDIKANTTNYIAEYNVFDSLDFGSGIINVNAGWHLMSSGYRSTNNTPATMLFRYNIIKSERASTSDGDGFRVSGPSTIENNIIFAGTGTTESGFFFYAVANYDTIVNENRVYGFPATTTSGGGATATITSTSNRSDVALGLINGSTAASGAYVGSVTGDAIADGTAPANGLGTGFKTNGTTDPYTIV